MECPLPLRARRTCAAADAEPLVAEGVWEGSVVDAPRGAGGFGYDPHFWLPQLGVTAAELDAAAKNRRSHRGIAMRACAPRWSAATDERGAAAAGAVRAHALVRA